MCRTVHTLLQTVTCGVQMLVRVLMTTILVIENIIRMLLQTIYNFISFLMQMVSLIPICIVFLLTSRLKCFMCGGGGPCPVYRGGTCDWLMSAMAIFVLFIIFRATGVLDKIFYNLGYSKAYQETETKFVPSPGDITGNESGNLVDYTELDNYDGVADKRRNKTVEELEMNGIKRRFEKKQHSKMDTRTMTETEVTYTTKSKNITNSTKTRRITDDYRIKFKSISRTIRHNYSTHNTNIETESDPETETVNEEVYYNYTTVVYYLENVS